MLCVGNTLLLNGTVHSPPYVVTARSAPTATSSKPTNSGDSGCGDDAEGFGLKLSIRSVGNVTIPAYDGSTAPKYARPS